jgi:hypothetical protein
MEEWRQLEDYPEIAVSNTGRVGWYYSGAILGELYYDPYKGYNRVRFYKEGKPTTKRVHRLVAQAFLPNPDNLPIVMHLDDNPSNNHVSNLRWGTHLDNMQDKMRKGRHRTKGGSNR